MLEKIPLNDVFLFLDAGNNVSVVVLWFIGVDLLREGAFGDLFSEGISEVDEEFLRFGGVDKLPGGAEFCKAEMRPSEEELTVEDDLLILVPMFPTIALRDEE